MLGAFVITPGHLSMSELKKVLDEHKSCVLEQAFYSKVVASMDLVQQVIKDKKIVYGINTGFGALAHQIISEEKLQQLQRNIVLSHACGTGDLLSDEIVALILLLKVNNLAQGYSGVRPSIIEALLALYNAGVYPCIPAKGSVGASGDLVPLAHLAMSLIGEGAVRSNGKILPAQEGLLLAGLKPLALAPKEGLALLNGLQVSAALCIQAFFKTELLFEAALLAGSLSVDAASASHVPFDERIHRIRGHAAQCEVAAIYRSLLDGSAICESHRGCKRVQDPYSLRCQPQIMGAVWHQMQFVRETLEVETNSVSDNPLVFAPEGDILSGGNFHGEIIAMAADNLALAIAEIGANAERRIALLVDHRFSGLPAFLVNDSGLNSGFMVAHVTAAASASDNKALAHPHSVDSIPTSANQEDHVSMATNAALRLHSMIDNTASIVAIELLAACQGLDFHAPITTSPKLQKVHVTVRKFVAPYLNDRFFAPDIAIIKQQILDGSFTMGKFL